MSGFLGFIGVFILAVIVRSIVYCIIDCTINKIDEDK